MNVVAAVKAAARMFDNVILYCCFRAKVCFFTEKTDIFAVYRLEKRDKMKHIVTIGAISAAVLALAVASCKGYEPMPGGEPEDPARVDPAEWRSLPENVVAAFGSVDVRYDRSSPPDTTSLAGEWSAAGWRGEKIHTQVVVATRRKLGRVSVECAGPLRGDKEGASIPAEAVDVGAVRYVLADVYEKNEDVDALDILQGAHAGNLQTVLGKWRSILTADGIEPVDRLPMEARTVRPFWVSVDIPRTARSGTYTGELKVSTDKHTFLLPFSVKVSHRELPEPSEWRFHLDLPQNPRAVAGYYGVEPWSDEHFEAMRPTMEMLARAGQKEITAYIADNPRGMAVYDDFPSMITSTTGADGTPAWDYSAFDRWVEFMTGLGITGTIECYSMLSPDDNPSDEAGYRARWMPMLTDFAAHLREKGWIGRTAIALEERPIEELQAAIALVREAAPEFRIAFAGGWHSALGLSVEDYSLAANHNFPDDVLLKRKMRRLSSSFITVPGKRPNTLTLSAPAESAWMGWHAAAMGLDGYTGAEYNTWPQNPLFNSRYGNDPSGETFLVYPGGRSSIRFERLMEGIQSYEKVRILRRSLSAFELAELEEELVQLTELHPSYLVLTYEKCVDNAARMVNSFD
jgi:hypothetical protein